MRSLKATPGKIVVSYDNVAELGDHVRARLVKDSYIAADLRPKFYGGSLEKAIEESQAGSVARVAKLKDHIDALNMAMTANRRTLKPDTAGPVLDVPAYLAGLPECFRRFDPKPEAPEVKIAVDLAIGCKSTADEIFNRAAAIVAFIDRLQANGRRINLVMRHRATINELSAEVTTEIKIKLNPIDLSELAFVLSPLCLRRLIFASFEILCNKRYVDAYGYCRRIEKPEGPAIVIDSNVGNDYWSEVYETPESAAHHVEAILEAFNAGGPDEVIVG